MPGVNANAYFQVDDYRIVEQAAEQADESVSQFLRNAALERAEDMN